MLAGNNNRLMVFMPPGGAKSTYCSQLFPAYFLSRPETQGAKIISASHSIDLSELFGRKIRNLVSEPDYQMTYGTSVGWDTRAVGNWSTTRGGEFKAAGVGTGITGHRGDLGLIDDPVKGFEAAHSATQRQTVWNWYLTEFRTRIKPGRPIILIMTRWHYDDLAGRILRDDYDFTSGWHTAKDGEKWYVINIPAVTETQAQVDNDLLGRGLGDSFWPSWFTEEQLAIEKAVQLSEGIQNWSSLYQQRPSPEEGAFFKREWFKYYTRETRPSLDVMKIYAASDYAVTKDDGDWTVHLIVGVDPSDRIYVLDMWRAQTESDVWIEMFISMAKKWHPLEWGEEKGQIIKSLDPFISKRVRETRTAVYRQQYPSIVDKVMRAQTIRARTAQGFIYFPADADWMGDFEHELLTFPSGKNDDMVDAFSLLGRMLPRLAKGKEPPKPVGAIHGMADGKGVNMNQLFEDEADKQRYF